MTLRKEEIYTVYDRAADITFIMKDVFGVDDEPISLECLGFHFGEPSSDSIKFVGKLKAEF
jgi:hypothetical protein